VIYRRANRDDEPQITVMIDRLLELAPADPFFRNRDFTPPPEWFFVAQDKGSVVGMICAAPIPGAYWYSSHFYVEPEYRGQGIGRGLLEAASAYHKQDGRPSVFAIVSPETFDTYKTLGFSEVAKTMMREA
jgi:GNAT superfamily N-acetyltransferase